MSYLLLALLAAAAIFLVVLQTGCKPSPPSVRPEPAVRTATPQEEKLAPLVPIDPTGKLSREEIRRALGRLAKSRPDIKVGRRAMCYVQSAPPATVDYVCPKCGEKTLYAHAPSDTSEQFGKRWELHRFLSFELPACRIQITSIQGLDAKLDETQFCRKCSPKVSQPNLVLVVRYPDAGEPHRCEGITLDDFELIRRFLAGSEKLVGIAGEETALKHFIPRLRELLGVKP